MILNDNPAQAEIAAGILTEPAFVGLGVLIEIVWVMRFTYKQPREAIAHAIETILDLSTVQTPDEGGIRWALGRYRLHGADLPDMLHIIAAKGATSFASFEKRLANHAGPESPLSIERL